MKRLSLGIFAGIFLFLAVNCGPATVAPSAPSAPSALSAAAPALATTDYVIPDTVITGPGGSVRRGKNIVIGVQPLASPAPPGLAGVTYNWVICPKVEDLFAWPDNTKASFGSGMPGDPGEYTITLLATYVYADGNGKYAATRTVQVDKAITVIDQVQPPTPQPQPQPTPQPPAPPHPVFNEKFGLSSLAHNAANTLPPNEAAALAASFRGVASNATLKTKADVVGALVQSNTAALGASLGNWKTALDAIAVKLNSLPLQGTDYTQALNEIAAGLEAVR